MRRKLLGGKIMMPTQWEVTKYGQLMHRSDIETSDIGVITTKIYKYKDKHYAELWDNIICIHFSEVN